MAKKNTSAAKKAARKQSTVNRVTSETSVNIVKSAHDPKNREVQMLSDVVGGKKVFVITKQDTGFASDPISLKEAEEIFDHQINCSQNQ